MSKYNVKNEGTIGRIGDDYISYVKNEVDQRILIGQIDNIISSIDNDKLETAKAYLLIAKNEINNKNTKSAIDYIKQAGPWISDVAKKVGAGIILDIIK